MISVQASTGLVIILPGLVMIASTTVSPAPMTLDVKPAILIYPIDS